MIDAQAVVGETVTIGAGTRVWQFASLIRGARIGNDCSIGACAVVDGAEMGDRCTVGHGAQIHPGTLLGAGVFVGPGAIICNDRWPRVTKDCFDCDALLDGRLTTVRIDAGASIGAGAIVLPGVVVGEGAMVAAGAVVGRCVPPLHLFKRSGEIVPIDTDRRPVRMREAVAA